MLNEWRCVICGWRAQFLWQGSSYCETHFKRAQRAGREEQEKK